MAEPVKIKFEYSNPDNVEAEVPGTQKLREAVDNGDSETQAQPKLKHRLDRSKLGRKQQVNTNREDKSDDNKTKTKIPVFRFRQTVEKVKAERRGSDKKEQGSNIPIRRSSIPKLTNRAPTKPIRKAIAKTEVTEQVTAPKDEFDKLYDEVVHSPTPYVDESILDLKVEDPEKLESKFEEIIHDYENDKPVDVERVKKSKIPSLKRRSHHEIDVGDKNGKIIAARDKLRKRHSLKDGDLKYLPDTTKTNGDTKFDRNKVQRKDTVSVEVAKNDTNEDTVIAADDNVTSSKNYKEGRTEESTKVVGNTTVTEIKTDKSSDKTDITKGQMEEENIYKGYVKVGIPVFDSYVHEHTEKSNTERIVEAKKVHSDNEDLKLEGNKIIEISNESIVTEEISNTEPSFVDIADMSNDKVEANVEIIAINNEYIMTEEIGNAEPSFVDIADMSNDKVEANVEIIAINDEHIMTEEISNTEPSFVDITDISNDSVEANAEIIEIVNEPINIEQISNAGPRFVDITDDKVEVNVETIETSDEPISTEEASNVEPSFVDVADMSNDSIESNVKIITISNEPTVTEEINNAEQGFVDVNDVSNYKVEANVELIAISNIPIVTQEISIAEQGVVDTTGMSNGKVETNVETIEISNKPIVTEEISNAELSFIEETDSNSEKVEANLEIIVFNNDPIATEVISNAKPSFNEFIEPTEKEENETKDKKEVMKNKDGTAEDVAKLRGKVGLLISKLHSQEPNDENLKTNFGNDLPKKKSVMSKIAMFERHDTKPVTKIKTPKKDSKILKPFTKVTENTQITETVHVHDEVFKPVFQANNELTIDVNSVEINKNSDIDTQAVRAEMVVIETPIALHYEVENKVRIESDTLSVEKSSISEKVLIPVVRNVEPKNEVVNNVNGTSDIYSGTTEDPDSMVIIPKFKRVKDVLKRYESLNGHDEAPVKKTIEDLPKIRPINEIISAFKPEASQKSLDDMFAHQAVTINEILSNITDETEKSITERSINNIINIVVPIDNSNNKEALPSNGIHNNLTDTETKYTERNINNDISIHKSNSINDDRQSNDKKAHEFKSWEYKTLKSIDDNFKSLQFIQDYHESKAKDMKRAKSLAELDLGDAVKGKVSEMIVRMNSVEKIEVEAKEVVINNKEMPRKRSVLEKIALFERKLTTAQEVSPPPVQKNTTHRKPSEELSAALREKINELSLARTNYGKMADMPSIELANGVSMPVLAVGTALLDPQLAFHIVSAAIDLGYRAIDSAYIYGTEKVVGEAIRAKIKDGTVKREDLFIIGKLWSTFHRTDLVKSACEDSLNVMGLDYFDLYLIHNPMSFMEGGSPLPKIATVLQYSESDYLNAWFGLETLGKRVRALGVSNFNSVQIQRILDKAKVKPVVNQVECHPYLTQQRLGDYCSERNITLSCFGVLGSKGTPAELKSGFPAVIDDPMVKVMASGLNMSPAQLLIRYQIECGHGVVVKSSSAAHLWDNLQALTFNLTSVQMDALHALNKNKRNFSFKGMGHTHKNYPFKEPF